MVSMHLYSDENYLQAYLVTAAQQKVW